jgi:hypothetical protein
LIENVFNGALGGAGGWTAGAAARLGTTVMHCTTGGLVGWGWGQLWQTRRPWRLLGTYGAAVGLHGLWNAASIGSVLLSASAWLRVSEPVWMALMGAAMIVSVGGLVLMTVAFWTALMWSGRRLAGENREA